MTCENLKLDNQLCFPIYALSRLVIGEYTPYLEKLNLTYPQYLVLLVLWEEDNISIKAISKKLILNTNTLSPLLKRMEKQELIIRQRLKQDERKVIIKLTKKAKELQKEALPIPSKLVSGIDEILPMEDLLKLKDDIYLLIDFLKEKQNRN